ncbi:arylsulfatase [Propioniciclava soli]|uniref:Arylsulfatase n=1 Tax=Propioniciclava soli TaxID=2775081 RepID=A0ABZ3C9I0_9ACTN
MPDPAPPARTVPHDPPRTNVILICADQWRADCLGSSGHPDVSTPALDRLATQGVSFDRAYSATPTCVPARMALMTGLTPESHGRVGYADGAPFNVGETLPRAFAAAGYHTQAIGKMHYWPERVRIGFDDVLLHDGYLHHSRRRGRPIEEYDDYVPWLRDQPGATAREDYLDHGLGCNSMAARPWDKEERLHPTNWLVTEAERWLYRRDPTAPFFLYLSFHRPHAPLDPPQWAWDLYADAELTPPVQGDWRALLDPYRVEGDTEALVAHFDDRAVHRARAAYYGLISHVDAQISRLLQILGEFGLADDTAIAFVSDHGDMLGDHGMWRKGYAYEGSSRVPLLLAGPGVPRGTRVGGLVELRDVMPTLLELAGVPVPPTVEGRSALRLFAADGGGAGSDAEPDAWRTPLFGEHTILGQSMQWVVGARHKYVWWSGDGHEQLFDLVADPTELHDLARDDTHADALATHRALLIDHLTDRPEGFVREGVLTPGASVGPLLDTARTPR